jgi:hypothetical protein
MQNFSNYWSAPRSGPERYNRRGARRSISRGETVAERPFWKPEHGWEILKGDDGFDQFVHVSAVTAQGIESSRVSA